MEKEARTPREDREVAPKLLQGPGGQLSVPMPGPLWARLRLTQFGSSMGGAREMEYHRTNRNAENVLTNSLSLCGGISPWATTAHSSSLSLMAHEEVGTGLPMSQTRQRGSEKLRHLSRATCPPSRQGAEM